MILLRLHGSCPNGLIHTYEPLAEAFALLQQKLALNNAISVRVFSEAVKDSSGPAVSIAFETTSGASGVKTVTLAHVLDRLPGGKYDFLKVDCEGWSMTCCLATRPRSWPA